MPKSPLILASASPRRRELLALMGVPFVVETADADETCGIADIALRVEEIARRKCAAVAALHPDRAVLAADTLVAADGRALGKPASAADAADMLRALSGRWHAVYSGVCLYLPESAAFTTAHDETRVRFSDMTDDHIARYVATGEPMDKAGAYAVQGCGGQFVEEIAGSPSNVIGLPMALVRAMLEAADLLPRG